MNDILRNINVDKQKLRAWLYAAIIVVYTTALMYNGGDADTGSILNMDPSEILVIQAIGSTLMFVGFSLLFIRFVLKLKVIEFFPAFDATSLGLIAGISISFMIINSAIGEWNMNLTFPDSSFSDWAERSEEQLKVLTQHITNFTSPTQFLLAILAVAVVPAIGEELLFRGLLQNFLIKAFSNHHVGIWVSGFIFAAIHMQFFGVFPRMFLGVLFGYLYHWSGNLSLAMVAHFINNGLAITLLYLSNLGTIEVTPEQMESSAPWPVVAAFSAICFLLISVFYKKYGKSNG